MQCFEKRTGTIYAWNNTVYCSHSLHRLCNIPFLFQKRYSMKEWYIQDFDCESMKKELIQWVLLATKIMNMARLSMFTLMTFLFHTCTFDSNWNILYYTYVTHHHSWFYCICLSFPNKVMIIKSTQYSVCNEEDEACNTQYTDVGCHRK